MLRFPYQKLIVWQKSLFLARKIYVLTKSFPRSEIYGLVSQMQRAAVSVPSNIAEGSQRGTNKDFGNYIAIARGSLAELETQIILAHQIEYVTKTDYEGTLQLIEEIARMLNSFAKKLATTY